MINQFGLQGVIYCTLIVVAAVIVVVLVKAGFRHLLHPVKKVRVQLAGVDRDNHEAARNLRMVPGQNRYAMNSSMGRSIIDDAFLTFYLLDKNRKKLILKMPGGQIKEMKEGDLGEITYQGDRLLSFERTGNIENKQ